ncbi:MAG: phage holin family protein [Deltaproteobacteria bacterium]|nr:phage holin family protein [Deltaproteobacteria bacterium]
MTYFFIRWLMLAIAIIFASYVLEGIHVQSFFSAFFAAAFLGLLNAFFRPVLIIITLPINILSMGLFTFVINALLLKMVSGVIGGFEVYGFWTAIFGSLIISAANWFLSSILQRQDYGGPEGKGGKETDENYIDLTKRDDKWE